MYCESGEARKKAQQRRTGNPYLPKRTTSLETSIAKVSGMNATGRSCPAPRECVQSPRSLHVLCRVVSSQFTPAHGVQCGANGGWLWCREKTEFKIKHLCATKCCTIECYYMYSYLCYTQGVQKNFKIKNMTRNKIVFPYFFV